ncbi:MAG: ribbon-helix-helix domain-containing protein [Planctomycetota bacterium]
MMIPWNISVHAETDRMVRAFLDRGGEDLAAFVEQAVRRELFLRTLKDIHAANEDISADEAARLAEEAVKQTRARSA